MVHAVVLTRDSIGGLGGQLAQPDSQSSIVRMPSPVPPDPSVHPDQPTGMQLAQPCLFPHDTHRLPLALRAYHFFESTSFNASMSKACCATILFNPPFSSSSWRRSLASFTSSPPHFAFQR